MLAFPFGYQLRPPLSYQVPWAHHMSIDDDNTIQTNFRRMLGTITLGPIVLANVTDQPQIRSGQEITLAVGLQAQPLWDIAGLKLRSATLGGVNALNIGHGLAVGDIAVGGKKFPRLVFPASVGAPGEVRPLNLMGEDNLGRPVAIGRINVQLP